MENSLPDTETLRLDRSKPFWWRKLTDCDPISLEPLRKLRVEPFELSADDEGVHASWFDGRLLSTYLVSSGNFSHPISRRELTKEDCQRLDAHLRKYHLGKPIVEYSFNHKADYKQSASPENQVRQLQQEAARLLESLYIGRGGREAARASVRTEGRGGAQQADDGSFVETVPLGGAEIESPADFPTLSQAGLAAYPSEEAVAAAAPQTASWVVTGSSGRHAGLHPAMRSGSGSAINLAEDFPSLGGSGFPSLGSGSSSSRANSASLSASPAAARWAGAAGSRVVASYSQPAEEVAAPAAPNVPGPAAFPSLGGSARTPQVSGQWSRGGSSAAAIVAAPPPPIGAGAASMAPVPPPEFKATVSDFPTLGAAPARAQGGAPSQRAPSQKIGATSVPEEVIQRNRALMANLAELERQQGTAGSLLRLRDLNVAFQKGEMLAPAFVSGYFSIFGEPGAPFFRELAELYPDA